MPPSNEDFIDWRDLFPELTADEVDDLNDFEAKLTEAAHYVGPVPPIVEPEQVHNIMLRVARSYTVDNARDVFRGVVVDV